MIKNIIKTRNLIEKQRHELMSAVRALPQNDNIKLLGKNCFVVKFSQLGKSLAPEYYDFCWQYNKIANIIEKADMSNIENILLEIIETGRYRETCKNTSHYIKFHPQVLMNLAGILCPALREVKAT